MLLKQIRINMIQNKLKYIIFKSSNATYINSDTVRIFNT